MSNAFVKHSYVVCGLVLCLSVNLTANPSDTTQTVGLFFCEEGSFDGCTLFSPLNYESTYLIDNQGRLIRSWGSDYRPGNTVYLLENGNLLRTASLGPSGSPRWGAGGAGGRVEEFDWDGSPVWEFEYATDQHFQHHDIEKLSDGNILLIAWEYKSSGEALTAGRDPGIIPPGGLWPDHIFEVEPDGETGGTIVWEWHVWDHLIQDYDNTRENYGAVEDHPELIDLNFVGKPGPDWTHTNSVDYNEEFDQILLSVPTFREIWVIDHSTTTLEAAGHTGGVRGKGGDLLYRWGNPQTYRAGASDDQMLFVQHDVEWIGTGLPGAGNILLFDNGNGRPEGYYSSIDEITPPVDDEGNYYLEPGSSFGPREPEWVYTAENPEDFYGSFLSGSQRLPNGNTLICEGPNGVLFEVTAESEVLWLYINPVTDEGPMVQGDPIPHDSQSQLNSVFRTDRYPPDYPGFDGKDMTPGDPIEIYLPTGITESVPEEIIPRKSILRQNVPNPFNPRTEITYTLTEPGVVRLKIFCVTGKFVRTLVDGHRSAGAHLITWDGKNDSGEDVGSGIYLCRLHAGGDVITRKLLLLR